MLFLYYVLFTYSIRIDINQNSYTGNSYEEILTTYGSDVSTINSIVVQEGDFPVNSISNEYTNLVTLEVPTDSFTSSINDELFKNMDLLKTVIIDGATSIGTNSFENCVQLETVRFSSCTLVNSKAFQSCSLLETVSIPKVQVIKSNAFSNTKIASIECNFLTTIEDYGFSDCSLLSSITVPLLETIGAYCFKGTALKSLTLDKLTSLGASGHCFDSCTSLEIIQIDNIEILTQFLFNGCISLHTFIGDSVTTIQDSCFLGCEKLVTVTCPYLVTIENNAFKGIITIEEVNFPFVKTVGTSAYEGCTGLKTVVLETCHTVGTSAFNGCIFLSRVEIPKLRMIHPAAFRNIIVESLEFPELDAWTTGTIDGANGIGGFFIDCKRLKTFSAPNLAAIPARMFSGCHVLNSLEMDNAQTIGSNAFSDCNDLTTLILPSVTSLANSLFSGNGILIHIEFDSVNYIGKNCFQSCSNLETVSFLSCVTAEEYAFDDCRKLESVNMPNLSTIGGRAFSYTKLREVEMNSLTSAGTTYYNSNYRGSNFLGCTSLTSVTMKTMSYVQREMFYDCNMLSFLDMPYLITINYQSFYGCNTLENLTLPRLNTIGESAFQGVPGLIEVNLPSVTTINSHAFESCPNLLSFSSENCSLIGEYAFNNCFKLESIYFPKLREIGGRSFSYTNLSSIELNALAAAGTTYYNSNYRGSQFLGCSSLTNVTMKTMSYIPREMFSECDKLVYIDMPHVTSIVHQGFTSCNSLENLVFPSLNSIGESSFQGLPLLTEIDLPSITSIGDYAFQSCPNLVSFSAENCTSIGKYAFNGCSKLQNINFPNVRVIQARAFSYTNLSSIELNSFAEAGTDYYNSQYRGAQFSYCPSLVNVTMKIMPYIQVDMFLECGKLSFLDMPQVSSISLNGVNGCNSLSNLTFPSLVSIGANVFKGIPGIVEVNLPSITSIGNNAFEGCSNLVSFYAENCTYVGKYAFNNCAKLKDIYFPKLTEIGARAFSYTSLSSIELNSFAEAGTEYYSSQYRGAQFSYCRSLVNATLKRMSYIQSDMFLECNKLIYIDMPQVTFIYYNGLYGCSSLNNITFPNLNSIGERSFQGNGGLTEINLPSLTSIGVYAFQGCPNLVSFSAENCTYIGQYAFDNCAKLEVINLPTLNEVGPRVFSYTKLGSIELNSLTIAGTTYYNSAYRGAQFLYCISLKKATLGKMPYIQSDMFMQCTNLEEVYIPQCDSMNSNCFDSCYLIRKLTTGYETIGYGSIPSPQLLTHVSFPNAKTVPANTFLDFKELISCKLPLVSTIDDSAFKGCLKLTELEIPSVVELIGDSNFENCENLPSISLRSLVTVNSTSANIFQGCRGLKYISLPDRPPKVFHRDTFKDLTCKIYIPTESITIYDNDDSIEGDEKNDHKWCGLELDEFDMTRIVCDEQEGAGVTLLEACVSAGVSTSVVLNLRIISGHLTQEEMISFNNNFADLTELTIESSVSIENDIIPRNFLLNHQKIQTVRIFSSLRIIDESAFEGCSQLSTLNCPNVKDLKSRCFYGPTSLEMLSFELVDTIEGSHFFSNNEYLKNIELPKLTTAILTGYISENSPLIASISLPETPPELPQGKFLFDNNPYLIGVSNKAAVEYDAADTVSNDMHFYSLKLKYTLFIISVDGDRLTGVTLKSIIPEGASIVEIIQGEITDSDFPLPETVTSFTVRENVSVKSIPAYAFSENTNLKTVSILSTTEFPIKEEAFSGCTSLLFAQISNAISIQGLAFKGCFKLKTVVLDDVQTIIGNSHFEGCKELKSVSFLSLQTIPQTSNRIFLGCSKFSTIKLPSKPPQRFHKSVFAGLENQLSLVLPEESDYLTYDNDKSIENDELNDGLWCGIALPTAIINIKVNQRGNIYNGLRLSECIAASGVSENDITSLEIIRGVLPITALVESVKNLPFLQTLKISSSIIYRGEFTDGLFSGFNFVSITLPSVTTIPQEFFKDCINLKNVEINDAKKVCSSAFKGCTSLEMISLNVDTFEGDSIFEGCTSLSSVSITNLVTVDPTAANIFSQCPLASIYLPVEPPKTFNKDTFTGKNVLIIGLTNDQLQVYDANTDVEGDVPNDLKWCGIDLIQLYITVSVNDKPAVNSSTLASAAELSGETEIKSIEIMQGMVKKTHMNELRTFPQISRLTITENAVLESSVIEAELFKNMTNFIHVKIMQNVTLMAECFSGCTSLLSIEFAEAPLLSEGSFRNCSSLNTIKIPYCKELRGDFIFSGCSNLRDVDLSSISKVDQSASKIFEGCSQLTLLRLPSIEPQTFHKDTFENCSEVKLVLPNNADYLAYDDESHVVDDVKEDEKWCGIKIDSEFLPPFLTYKINDIEYRSRKLKNQVISLAAIKLLEDEINDNETQKSSLKTLELLGGLVDSNELKEMIKNSLSIEKFEAHIGTLNEIASGTFSGCKYLKEIILHTEVFISVGALQNIPSLLKLTMDLQQSIRGDDLSGDFNLQEVNLPLLLTVPSYLFANFSDLKTIKLDTASMLHRECFKNCISLIDLELPNVRIIDGDSHFEGCSNLKTIDLSSLSTVHQSSSRIFMNCAELEELRFGIEPPYLFNEDIFTNAGVIPNITIPSSLGWKNYIPQCTVSEDTNHYMWYGFDTGIIKPEDEVQSCPECPEISSCNEIISCPEMATFTECPEVPECSCPEVPECSYPETPSKDFTSTLSMGLTLTHVLKKSVTFSMQAIESNIFVESLINGEYTMVQSVTLFYSLMPYLIHFYSFTSSKTFVKLDIFNNKKKITPEMLIGFSCGGAAIFFILLALVIMYCRGKYDTYSDILLLSDSDEVNTIQAEENNNDVDANKVKQDKNLQNELDSAIYFWF